MCKIVVKKQSMSVCIIKVNITGTHFLKKAYKSPTLRKDSGYILVVCTRTENATPHFR